MPHDDAQDRHDHSPSSGDTYGRCCGSKAIGPTKVKASDGRSFHVSGLDCAEEVSILNRVVGPEVGGTEYLAFDVINARMTVLDGGRIRSLQLSEPLVWRQKPGTPKTPAQIRQLV